MNKLKEFRNQNGLSNAELEEILGVGFDSIKKKLNGTRGITHKDLKKMKDWLEKGESVIVHQDKSPLAWQKVKLKNEVAGGIEIHIEDWWDRIGGRSWMECNGNPACMLYAIRCAQHNLPIDDEVLYGKIGPFGHLVHISELEI